jgi:hypothetical protein
VRSETASPLAVAALLMALLWSERAPEWRFGDQAIRAGLASAWKVAARSAEVVMVTLNMDKEAQ